MYNAYNSKYSVQTYLKQKRRERQAKKVRKIVIKVLLALTFIALLLQPYKVTYQRPDYVIPDPCGLEVVVCEDEAGYHLETQTVSAFVTGYNTVKEQTDSTPCIAASGDDICGRTDVVACPSAIPLGTQVVIDGKNYTCLDRTHAKFDGRYDISCDKDKECPKQVTGYKDVTIIK